MGSPNWKHRTLFVADNIFILHGMDSESVTVSLPTHPLTPSEPTSPRLVRGLLDNGSMTAGAGMK